MKKYEDMIKKLKSLEVSKQIDFQDYDIIKANDMQKRAVDNLRRLRVSRENKALVIAATGERVIIVTGCINALVSRVSETFIKNNSCIA